MELKYNSVMSLLTSIDHKNIDGSDITADQIRKKFLNRLNNLDDSELLEAIILEDTANCD
jgi:hypothetical protein|tara:strand:- start:46 stop:225 length:180 start_codon:yes stop_codon:yes gene_type:complete